MKQQILFVLKFKTMTYSNIHNTLEDIIIKLINADENRNVPNNSKHKHHSIIVVVPHDASQIVVDGFGTTTDNNTKVHYTISIQRNQNTPLLCKNKDSEKLWRILKIFIKLIFLKLLNKVKYYLHQDTFNDYIKKGVKIFRFIKYLLEWRDCFLYIFDNLNFDGSNISLTYVLDIVSNLDIIVITRVSLWIMSM